jgi:hypothetical protein
MNPLSDFLSEYGVQKEAAMPSPAARFGHAVVSGVSAAGAAGVVATMGLGAHKAYDALTKSHDFKNMLSYNPDLKEHHERDPRMFNQMYTSLRGINPQFGKDPLVAGSFMRRMVDQGGNAGGVLTSAVPTGRGNQLMQELTMLGAGAGAAYYSDLSKSRARRDVDPASETMSEYNMWKARKDMNDPLHDLRSQHERAEMEHAPVKRDLDRMKAEDYGVDRTMNAARLEHERADIAHAPVKRELESLKSYDYGVDRMMNASRLEEEGAQLEENMFHLDQAKKYRESNPRGGGLQFNAVTGEYDEPRNYGRGGRGGRR